MKKPLIAGPLAWSPLVLLWIGAAVSAGFTPAFKTLDSESYQGTISLTGHYTRGWPTILLYEIFPPDALAIAAQTVVYVVAWTILLIGWTLYKKTLTSFVFSLILVAFALTPAMVGWNVTILSEPLTISLIVLGVGLLGVGINYHPKYSKLTSNRALGEGLNEGDTRSNRKHRLSLVIYMASALCFSLAAVNRITVVPLVVVPTLFFLTTLFRASGHRKLLGVCVLACVLLFVYPIYFGSESNRAWNDSYGVSRTTIYFFYGTSVTAFSPQFADHVYSGVTEGGPSCLTDYRARFEGPGPFDVIKELVKDCPQGARWVDESFSRRYLQTLVAHPRVVANHLLKALPETAPGLVFSQALYGSNQVVTILPVGIISVFDASVSDQVRSLPFILWGLLGVLLSALGLRISFVRSERWWMGVGLFWMSGIGIVLTIIALADELSRSAAPSTAGLILGAILLLQEGVSRGVALAKG